MRIIINNLSDSGSVIELRKDFGVGIITSFIRIGGISFGLIANDPFILGGAIDAEAGEKAAKFLQLCDNFRLPVIFSFNFIYISLSYFSFKIFFNILINNF